MWTVLKRHKILLGLSLLALAGLTGALTQAQTSDLTRATPPVPAHPGPYLPPSKREPSGEPPAAGESLHRQALQKLKKRFEEADLDASGSLSKEEAAKAELGFVVQHFDEIDQARRGAVSFEDMRAYLVKRRKEVANTRSVNN